MKRSKQLETLSFEHHDGLVVANRVKRGLEKQANTAEMVAYVLHIWDTLLVEHFAQEEATLLEVLERTPEARERKERMLKEHQEFAGIVEKLREGVDIEQNLTEFAELLNNHIRFEERELFPLVEELATEEELEKIGRYLHEKHVPGEKDWGPAFWA